jgi:FixJ family two-component response regulator
MTATRDTVIVIDDDPSMREALAGLLETVALDVELYGSAEEFLKTKRRDVPTCIVLDVRLPGPSGLDIQRELREAHLQIPIIFITGHGDIPMSVQAIKEGAVEFLTKPIRDQDLLDAVRVALKRDRSWREHEKAIADLKERFRSLTLRERQVMALAVSGRVAKQIAAEIGINEVTVRVHRGQVMRKMGARSLAELVRIADKLSSVNDDA